MSNIGYREIVGYDALSLKQLNDNMRALWGKVMGDIEYRDLSKDARAVIESKLEGDDLIGYSTIEQTAEAIRMEVGRVDESVARLQVLTDRIAADVADMDGDVSQVKQTASALSSTVSSLSGAVSQVQQTASGLSSTVVGLGGRVSALEQTASGVAVEIYDPSISTTFKARVGTSDDYVVPGLEFDRSGVYSGGVYPCGRFIILTSNGADDSYVNVDGGDGSITVGYDGRKAQTAVTAFGHMLPYTGDTCDLGGNGGGMRWRYAYLNNSVNTSDERVKRDVAPLNAADLLTRLAPIRYRMKDDPDGKLRFGFIAQHVAEALKGTDYEDAELLHDSNPDLLHLCYQELIAVLVEGYQKLALRVEALERSE